MDAVKRRFDARDILIASDDGRMTIEKIGEHVSAEGVRSLNVNGLMAVPSFCDLWARMGEPGFEYRETFQTGSNSAVCGGFGTVLVQPFGQKITDNADVLKSRVEESSESSKCRLLFCGALSLECKGKALCDYDALADAGAVAFSDGPFECLPDNLLREAMIRLSAKDRLLIACPTFSDNYKDALINLGRASKLLGVNGIPASAATR